MKCDKWMDLSALTKATMSKKKQPHRKVKHRHVYTYPFWLCLCGIALPLTPKSKRV